MGTTPGLYLGIVITGERAGLASLQLWSDDLAGPNVGNRVQSR